MDILTLVINFLTTGENILAMGWLGLFIVSYVSYKLYKENKIREDSLRSKIEELQENHAELLSAVNENRINDLKSLVDKYDLTMQAVVSALEKIGGKKK